MGRKTLLKKDIFPRKSWSDLIFKPAIVGKRILGDYAEVESDELIYHIDNIGSSKGTFNLLSFRKDEENSLATTSKNCTPYVIIQRINNSINRNSKGKTDKDNDGR